MDVIESILRAPNGLAHHDARSQICSPPATATSTSETVTTADEDAQRCEEWELFTECGSASRPSSEPFSDVAGSVSTRSWISDCSTHRSDTDAHGDPSDAMSRDPDESKGDSHRCDEELVTSDASSEPKQDGFDTPEDCKSRAADSNPSVLRGEDAEDPSTTQTAEPRTLSTPASLQSSRIQVYVRVRPPTRTESQVDAVAQGETRNSIRVNATSSGSVTECEFDAVFMDHASQKDVYDSIERGVLSSLSGYNATVFAYGQTGTGKTHTMFGEDVDGASDDINEVPDGWGIIPRALQALLRQSQTRTDDNSVVDVSCSVLQVYNDRVYDLLTDRKRQKPLLVREQPTLNGGTSVVIQGLSNYPVRTLSDALELVRRGRINRFVRETELNASSSRSHAIVQVNISIESRLSNGDRRIQSSRLNLVDLAGSEKWNTDIDLEDRHAQELKNINTSLSALGNCIAALAESGRRHIPYRDSTLTRILQDSFGGNTLAYLIATVSPLQKSSEETIRTLQFADRARSVIQVVRVNESFSGSSELLAAKAQIKSLRERLALEQSRRRETRIKEYEAMQREFTVKLQTKDEDIERLTRDNEVFSKWRTEDVNKIRMLEAKIKELEAKTSTHGGLGLQKAEEPQADLVTSTSTSDSGEEDNQAVVEHARRPVVSKSSAMTEAHRRVVPRTKSKPRVHESKREHAQAETHAATPTKSRRRSYRSLIDKYSHGASMPQRNDQDALRSLKPERQANHTTNLKHQEWTPHTVKTHGKPPDLPQPWAQQVFSVPDSPTKGSHYDQSRPFPSVAQASKVDYPNPYHPQASTQRADSTYDQSWQLPAMPGAKYIPTNRVEPSAPVNSKEICGKHSLKGCVLCAAKDHRAPAMQHAASVPAMPSISSSYSPRQAQAYPSSQPDPSQPCDRHRLPGCFLCNSSTAWRPSPAAPAVSFPTTTSMNSSSSTHLPPSQSRSCAAHMLANCVLCAGTTASRAVPSQAEYQQPKLNSTLGGIRGSISHGDLLPRQSEQSNAHSTSFSSALSYPSRHEQGSQAPYQAPSMAIAPSPSQRPMDSNTKKQLNALLREASDAAKFALRHRC